MHNNDACLELSEISKQINDRGADLRELYQSLHEKLAAIKADGDEVPAAAIELEH